MATVRMVPPIGGEASITFNGRTYSCASGSSIDVPDFDAAILNANGWTRADSQGSGPTSLRPTSAGIAGDLAAGDTFLDTTLGFIIVWDGQAWRNPVSGALA